MVSNYKTVPEARPSVSLVVPCTAEDTVFVSRLLDSVNYQTAPPVEVIVSISGIAPGAARRLEQRWRAVLLENVPLIVLDAATPSYAGPNRQRGSEVARGEVIGTVGKSGNANTWAFWLRA